MGKKKFKLRRPKLTWKIPTAVRSSSAPLPPWVELPRDVTANILLRLSSTELLESVQKVCTTWRSVCQDPAMWRVIDLSNVDDSLYDLETLCRHAVDRSQGQLIDINIEYFGTDELLHYISERSSQLKRLRLACCNNVSGKGLSEAAKKFPQLEELHLVFLKSIQAGDVEAIGLSCPMLKSFTFNDCGYKFPLSENNEHPMAIAKGMPALCHLRLLGNKMTNEGLKAILDGCPHLESLDLRQCFSVDLQGDLGKRCSQQIKDLRLPRDNTSDYEWDAEIYESELDDVCYSSDYSDNPPLWHSDDYTDHYSTESCDFHSPGDYDDFIDPFENGYFNDNDGRIFYHDYN